MIEIMQASTAPYRDIGEVYSQSVSVLECKLLLTQLGNRAQFLSHNMYTYIGTQNISSQEVDVLHSSNER